jgi:hypothetical protein
MALSLTTMPRLDRTTPGERYGHAGGRVGPRPLSDEAADGAGRAETVADTLEPDAMGGAVDPEATGGVGDRAQLETNVMSAQVASSRKPCRRMGR